MEERMSKLSVDNRKSSMNVFTLYIFLFLYIEFIIFKAEIKKEMEMPNIANIEINLPFQKI